MFRFDATRITEHVGPRSRSNVQCIREPWASHVSPITRDSLICQMSFLQSLSRISLKPTSREAIRALSSIRSLNNIRGMSSQKNSDLKVEHEEKEQRFVIRFEDPGLQELAVLEYEMPRKNVMDMTHTGVPVSLRGRGIAGILAKEAFEHCVNNNLKMILSCTYLQKYYHDHPLPEYQQRVLDS